MCQGIDRDGMGMRPQLHVAQLDGLRSRSFVFDADWRPKRLSGISFDLGVNHYGSVPATLDDLAVIPAYTTVDWDVRYAFKLGEEAASLKFGVMNMFNVRVFRVLDAGTYGFFQGSGRRMDLRLIVDVT